MFNLLKYKNEVACINSSGNSFTYEDLNKISVQIGEYLEPNQLIFLITTNSVESLAGYISFLNSNCTVLMLGKDINNEQLLNYSNIYEPAYYWLPNEFVDTITLQEKCVTLNGYTLLKSKYPKLKMPNNLAMLLTTSGSTGSPKLVKLSQENILSNAESISQFLKITNRDRTITSLPMNYSFGLSIINSYLLTGASIILTDASYIQKDFWTLAEEFGCTSLSGVPYTFEILKKIKFWNKNNESLKIITQAGGKLANDLIQYFVENSEERGIKFYVMYGQTEATARISYLPPEKALEKLGSIGISIPGGKLSLVDDSGEVINNPNVIGELVYEGQNVSLGYAENKNELTGDDDNKSYLKTGDLAYRDEDGFYFITGRKSRFLKLFGNRINLGQIETLLQTQNISAACVGTDEKLIIYTEQYSDENNQILSYVSHTIKINKKTIEIRFIEQIPRNETGKILYSKLSSK